MKNFKLWSFKILDFSSKILNLWILNIGNFWKFPRGIRLVLEMSISLTLNGLHRLFGTARSSRLLLTISSSLKG